MLCAICRQFDTVAGVLCEECVSDVRGASQLCPEQIVTRVPAPLDAALVDRWGRVHPIGQHTAIGRQPPEDGLQLAESSVSRQHAEIVAEPSDTGTKLTAFRVKDLKSRNGTYVNEKAVATPLELKPGDIVFFGQVGMFFVSPIPKSSVVNSPQLPTMRPEAVSNTVREPLPNFAGEEEDDEAADTFLGLRSVDLALVAPAGGGGGVLATEGRTAQLTAIQFELLLLLADRMFEEEGRDERVRGFVRSSELLASLPWDTARPEDNHIKQLVRRVRRALVRCGIGDLIESRHGFGYRLRVKPIRRALREPATTAAAGATGTGTQG